MACQSPRRCSFFWGASVVIIPSSSPSPAAASFQRKRLAVGPRWMRAEPLKAGNEVMRSVLRGSTLKSFMEGRTDDVEADEALLLRLARLDCESMRLWPRPTEVAGRLLARAVNTSKDYCLEKRRRGRIYGVGRVGCLPSTTGSTGVGVVVVLRWSFDLVDFTAHLVTPSCLSRGYVGNTYRSWCPRQSC